MVIDVVDIVDQNLLKYEVKDLQRKGREPITLNAGSSSAVRQMIELVIKKAKAHSSITLLRMHGHGMSGFMGVAMGNKLKKSDYLSGAPLFISVTNVNAFAPDFARLRPFFAAGGRVELMGCYVAQGSAGASLLKSLSKLLGVPVSAGSRLQFAGGRKTFGIEGPVYTAFPSGRLKREEDYLSF